MTDNQFENWALDTRDEEFFENWALDTRIKRMEEDFRNIFILLQHAAIYLLKSKECPNVDDPDELDAQIILTRALMESCPPLSEIARSQLLTLQIMREEIEKKKQRRIIV